MDDKLDTKRLRYFLQVLDSGSVRGAAEVLDMDPSAVSRAVGVLEKECGTDASTTLAGVTGAMSSQQRSWMMRLRIPESDGRSLICPVLAHMPWTAGGSSAVTTCGDRSSRTR